jgi:hypothetical protein
MPDTLRAILLLGGGALLFAALVALGFGLVWYWWDRPQEVGRRRRAQGLCPRCGYNLSRIASRVCPECGNPK